MKKKKFVKLNQMKKPVKPIKKQKPDEKDTEEVVKPDPEDEPEEEPASAKNEKLCDCGKPVEPGSYQCAKCAHRA